KPERPALTRPYLGIQYPCEAMLKPNTKDKKIDACRTLLSNRGVGLSFDRRGASTPRNHRRYLSGKQPPSAFFIMIWSELGTVPNPVGTGAHFVRSIKKGSSQTFGALTL